jgi:hypothetical protein
MKNIKFYRNIIVKETRKKTTSAHSGEESANFQQTKTPDTILIECCDQFLVFTQNWQRNIWVRETTTSHTLNSGSNCVKKFIDVIAKIFEGYLDKKNSRLNTIGFKFHVWYCAYTKLWVAKLDRCEFWKFQGFRRWQFVEQCLLGNCQILWSSAGNLAKVMPKCGMQKRYASLTQLQPSID